MADAADIIKDFKTFKNPQILQINGLTFKRFTHSDSITSIIDYSKREELSSKLLQIKVINPAWQSSAPSKDFLEKIGNKICEHVNYLSERLKLIEIDTNNAKTQIRSYPPNVDKNKKIFFEIIFTANEHSITLTRKQNASSTPQPFVLTNEIIERYLEDIFAL